MHIVGILTNKVNISIEYYLVPYRLSTNSKTRDLEWPRMANFALNSVLRRYVWSSEA